MTTAAKALLEAFGVHKLTNQNVDLILGALLYTINENNLFDSLLQNVTDIAQLDLVNPSKAAYAKTVSCRREFIALQHNYKALQLILLLLADIDSGDYYIETEVAEEALENIVKRSNKNHAYSEIKKLLKTINSCEFGYKILQKPREAFPNKFVIVKYDSRDDLLEKLTRHNLTNPSILDKLL